MEKGDKYEHYRAVDAVYDEDKMYLVTVRRKRSSAAMHYSGFRRSTHFLHINYLWLVSS